MAIPADIAADSGRAFLQSHPWITFRLRVDNMPWRFWEYVGEARSKCRHLANSPLPPGVAEELSALYLAKGVLATTAIEGNTLSEEQALEAVRGDLRLPVGQEYLKQEIDNILAACSALEQQIQANPEAPFAITPDLLRALNRQVLDGLELEDHVVPGEFRQQSVVVGNAYRGAPWEDCPFLVELLCDWLNGPDFEPVDDARETFLRVVLRAAVAHIYIAWIHPFGDGNGRTARLIEFGILTRAGVPSVAAHLLSNHYNLTRTAYYRQLDYASKSQGDLRRFLVYAIEGFVGELQRQLDRVHVVVLESSWTEYAHEIFHGGTTAAPRRQLQLVLALPAWEWVDRSRIRTLSPQLAAAYADKGTKTVTRDINALVKRGLIERGPEGIRARREIMFGFLPRVAGRAVLE